MNKIWVIILSVLLASCTKDISIDVPNPGSKIVVNSFFSPHGSLLVNISKSIPIFDADTLNYIENAKIELLNHDSLIGVLSYDQKGYYILSSELMPNKEYSITVSVLGMENVSSQNTIPPQIPILSLDTITVNNKYLFCEIKFQDISKMSNYYLLEVTSKYPILNSDSILSRQVEIIVNENIVENGSIGSVCKRIFFSDEEIQGTEYDLSFLLEKEPLIKSLNEGSNMLYINFKTISLAYYKYLKSYYEAQTRQMDVYTNIMHGYGIFAGYNLSQDSIVIQ